MLALPGRFVTLVVLGVHALCHLLMRKSSVAHFSLTVESDDEKAK